MISLLLLTMVLEACAPAPVPKPICNIPSPKGNGAPHFMLGMIQEFTVN